MARFFARRICFMDVWASFKKSGNVLSHIPTPILQDTPRILAPRMCFDAVMTIARSVYSFSPDGMISPRSLHHKSRAGSYRREHSPSAACLLARIHRPLSGYCRPPVLPYAIEKLAYRDGFRNMTDKADTKNTTPTDRNLRALPSDSRVIR